MGDFFKDLTKSKVKMIIISALASSIPTILGIAVIFFVVFSIFNLFEPAEVDKHAGATYTIICEDDAAQLVAKILFKEVNNVDESNNTGLFVRLTTAAVVINNANGTSYNEIYSLTDTQYDGFSTYKDTPFEEVVPENLRGELLYVAETVLSGKYTLPKNLKLQASEEIVLEYGTVWTSLPASPNDVYFGYEEDSLSGTDVLGKELPGKAYSSIEESVAYYKELAKGFEKDDYSAFKASNICKKYNVGECGFTISKTSLSKSQYKEKLEELAAENPGFAIFAENSDAIYELAVSKNVNPELVVIRAYAEGEGDVTGSNNYWGLGCTNESQGAGCYSWDTFEEGYTYFIDVVAKYDSLAEMMGKYAYIGRYWYTLDTPNPDGDGGCYYAPHIYTEETMPAHVATACASGAPSCVINGDTTNCTPTTDDDQKAYATWQVKKNMASIRKTIFGLEYDEGPCTFSSTLEELTSYNENHAGLQVLNRSLTLAEVAQLNQYINEQVDKAQYGTGAAVAAAGQALTYGLEQKGYYLEYRWGGGHGSNFVGVSASWGSTSNGCDEKNRCYNGLDCSGFVSWAIRTGCNPNFGSMTTDTMVNSSLGPVISVKETKPGDLMLKNGHVRLVIKNNGDGTVIVAEEVGSPTNGLIFNKLGASSAYNFIDMSGYYSRTCNSSR